MDGYETSKSIRSLNDENKKNIPIIALTAAATINEIEKCFKYDMNDYLIKPFDIKLLVSKILKSLKIIEEKQV